MSRAIQITLIIAFFFLITASRYFGKQWRPRWKPHNKTFHQGLQQIFKTDTNQYFKISTHDSLKYKMDNHILILQVCLRNSIRMKRVKTWETQSQWKGSRQGKLHPWVCTIITMWVHQSVRPWSISENAYNYWTTWYVLIKISILMHVNIIYSLARVTAFFITLEQMVYLITYTVFKIGKKKWQRKGKQIIKKI